MKFRKFQKFVLDKKHPAYWCDSFDEQQNIRNIQTTDQTLDKENCYVVVFHWTTFWSFIH